MAERRIPAHAPSRRLGRWNRALPRVGQRPPETRASGARPRTQRPRLPHGLDVAELPQRARRRPQLPIRRPTETGPRVEGARHRRALPLGLEPGPPGPDPTALSTARHRARPGQGRCRLQTAGRQCEPLHLRDGPGQPQRQELRPHAPRGRRLDLPHRIHSPISPRLRQGTARQPTSARPTRAGNAKFSIHAAI